MDNRLIISVIVPIYNGEKYIRRAVDSVICQMDGRIELILVDDGSTDSSGTICDEYASKYPNVHVIHKSNGGTSSAKNMGIAMAKGLYLSFMDCDDYLNPTTYAEIIPVLLEYKPDCLDFGLNYVDEQGNLNPIIHKMRKNCLLSLEVIKHDILPPLLNLRKNDACFVFDYACNKIFNNEMIQRYHCRFNENNRTWEDRVFVLRHLKYCQSYYAMDRCFYNFDGKPDSLSQRYFLEFFNIILSNFNTYRSLYEDLFDFDTQYVNNYWAHTIENMIFRSLEQKEEQEQIRLNILETLRNEQVIYWFTKRMPKDRFEKKTSALVISGDVETALCYYEKKLAQIQSKQTINNIKCSFKQFLRKLIRR